MMVRDIKSADLGVMVIPRRCGVGRAGLAKRINAPLAIVDKRRERPGESEVMNVIMTSKATPVSWSTTSSIWAARS
jgi:ribose-phosphate pyrophosphokinase